MSAPLTLPLLLALALGLATAADRRVTPMDPTTNLKDQLAALPDAVYLQRQSAAVSDLPAAAALAGLQGVWIGAPRRVDAARGERWSALVLAAGTASREAALPWHTHAMLVACDVDRGTVFAAPAFPRDPSKSPDRPDTAPPSEPTDGAAAAPPPPSRASDIPPPPEPSSAGFAWLDVPGLLRLPHTNARVALRVIDFDRPSNPVLVQRLVDATPLPTTPAADAMALVARVRSAGQSALRLPSYRRSDQTPPLQGLGAVFTLSRQGQALPLHAALRIELFAPMMVQPSAAAMRSADVPAPTAIVRAALLVLRRNYPVPYLLPLEIPVWTDQPPALGKPIDAAFSVDLAALLPVGAAEPGAQVYLVAGRHLAGPEVLPR